MLALNLIGTKAHKKVILERNKALAYYYAHKEERASYSRKYLQRPEIKVKRALYRKENKETSRVFIKNWTLENKDRVNFKHKQRRDLNLEKARAKEKSWRDSNRNKVSAYTKKSRSGGARVNFLERQRDYHLKVHGITKEIYELFMAAQGGVCAICGETQKDGRTKNLCVDHDHVSGKIRGLLCNNCNRGIGLLKDSPDVLLKAIEYLKKRKEENQCKAIPVSSLV